MAEGVSGKGSADQKYHDPAAASKQATAKDLLGEPIVPIHKKISDVGQFSYAALCATTLHTLFDTEKDNKFKQEALAIILIALEQPQQVCESVRAMLDGQGQDDVDPFIDLLLAEEVLKEGAEPVISELLAIAIGKGCYDARMRTLIKHLAWRLKVGWETVDDLETGMSETLALAQYEMSDPENELELEEEKMEKAKKAKRSKYKRYALIGLATLGGGTLIGLTGGLAAPLVAAGAGAIIGGAGAAVLGSTAGVAIIGSLFGVAGAGLTGYKMKKRVGAVEEFEFEPLVHGNSLRVETVSSVNQLHITIAVTGWLTNSHKDCRMPWKNLAESKEQYALRWETKYLVQMGEALDYIFNSAMTMATQEALKYTVLSGLLAAVAWPSALLSVSNLIDNPWSVALQRSQSAGKMLAEVLLSREQGNRPVTLIGFSLGARVLFSCLEELSKRKGSEGIVEDVILLGTPATGDPKTWQKFASVVAGKIVNGYCRGDWLLKFLYRTSSVQLNIAGLRPIKWADRRMHNIDLSDVVHGHLDYKQQLDTIMKAVGVRTRDEVGQSSKSSSKTSSPTHVPDQAKKSDLDNISSSDEEAHVPNKVGEGKTSNEPVILEDYSPNGEGKKSGLFFDGSETNAQENVIPESASFDSGVEINRGESESRERLTDQLSPREEHPVKGGVAGIPENGAIQNSMNKDSDDTTKGASASGEVGNTQGQHSSDSQSGYLLPGDRIGDAAANGSDDDDSPEKTKESSATDDLGDEESVTVQSNLQRKQLFDSMYRLVLDDDLMDVMNDEDDDNIIDAKTTGNGS